MPRNLTLDTLVTRCQRRVDREGDLSISTPEWYALVSEQYGELYQAVAETGLRYFETMQTITANGAASYSEPTDMLSTVTISRVVNATSGDLTDLVEIMPQERARWSGRTGDAQVYATIDDQLYLYPRPSSGTYQWLYVPQAPDLTTYVGTASVDLVNAAGEAFLIWGVAVKALSRSESDVTVARAERDRQHASLTEWAVLRAMTQPRRRIVRDTDDCGPGDWRGYP